MPEPTPAQVIDSTQEFIDALLNRPPSEVSRSYHPGLHCYDAISGVNSTGDAVWLVLLEKAHPDYDELRLEIADYLYDRWGVGADVALEW